MSWYEVYIHALNMIFIAILIALLVTAVAYGLSRYSQFAPAILLGVALGLLLLAASLYYLFWLGGFTALILLLISSLLIHRRIYQHKTILQLDWVNKFTFRILTILVAYLASMVVQGAVLEADNTLFLGTTFLVLSIEFLLIPFLLWEKQKPPVVAVRKWLLILCIILPVFPFIIYLGSSQLVAQVIQEGNAKQVFPFLYLQQALGHTKKTNEALFLEAAAAGNAELISYLLEQGVDVNTADELQISALHQVVAYAPGEKVLSLLQLLQSKGANLNAENYAGYTPLMQASQDTLTVVKYLVEQGANINAEDGDGNTPFRQAARYGKKDICLFLLEKGAKVEKAEDIMAALESNQVGILQLVLEQGVIVDATDEGGYTALHKALLQSKTEMAAFLLKKGAKINEKILANLSNIKSPEIIDLLLKYGFSLRLTY
ncbi:hypothetical protein GXP67_00270 [Rhodocytophaga rosea]|uniref:Uncharacterized protein n=1 Tax=Rhodocytophaga rosea TaxID=2704465 RepID=A0A6C0GBG2_9BACT|nr:ankyrin repeat domain-containing protein [Rhodocytophaga rosea]QHT65218.1 hypothetical protein GXP67_00270 [Rhodocytophaga rosea]